MSPEASSAPQLLIDFRLPGQAATWRDVDDRVMGGVSRSRLAETSDGTASFRGELSLEQVQAGV